MDVHRRMDVHTLSQKPSALTMWRVDVVRYAGERGSSDKSTGMERGVNISCAYSRIRLGLSLNVWHPQIEQISSYSRHRRRLNVLIPGLLSHGTHAASASSR